MPQKNKRRPYVESPSSHKCRHPNPFGGRRLIIQTDDCGEQLHMGESQKDDSPGTHQRLSSGSDHHGRMSFKTCNKDAGVTALETMDGANYKMYPENSFVRCADEDQGAPSRKDKVPGDTVEDDTVEEDTTEDDTAVRSTLLSLAINNMITHRKKLERMLQNRDFNSRKSKANKKCRTAESIQVKHVSNASHHNSKNNQRRSTFTWTSKGPTREPSADDPARLLETVVNDGNHGSKCHIVASQSSLDETRHDSGKSKYELEMTHDLMKDSSGDSSDMLVNKEYDSLNSDSQKGKRHQSVARLAIQSSNRSKEDFLRDDDNKKVFDVLGRWLQYHPADFAQVKINMNTNAHGDENSQPVIITDPKPTHGKQKFLVRKNKQWNNGDGCKPSYVIHIESHTDQSSVCSRPQVETRRRRGDIVCMRHREILARDSTNTPTKSDDGGDSPRRKSTERKSSKSEERLAIKNGHQKSPSNGQDKNMEEIQSKPSDKRRQMCDKKEQGDSLCVSRGNCNLRLIDHLERKETSPDNIETILQQLEQLHVRKDGKGGSSNRLTNVPVIFKESVPWTQKQPSHVSDNDDASRLPASNNSRSHSTERNKREKCQQNLKVERQDHHHENKVQETYSNTNISKTLLKNNLQKEKSRKSPTVLRGTQFRHENDKEEGREYTLKYVTIPLELINRFSFDNYNDIQPFIKARHVRDVACQCSTFPEDDDVTENWQQNSISHSVTCSRKMQKGHTESTVSPASMSEAGQINSETTLRSEINKVRMVKASESNRTMQSPEREYNSPPRDCSPFKNIKSLPKVTRSSNLTQKFSKRSKHHVCRNKDSKSWSGHSKNSSESPDLTLYDVDPYLLDSPLPSWSSQNYNPNANFSSCEISPYIDHNNMDTRRHMSITGRTSVCSSDQETVGMTNPRLNENYSNQRSCQSSEGEPDDESIVLEPMTPSTLYKPPGKDEPPPRYSAPMSLEKLQKLIEETKSLSRVSVKILDRNTNFDGDCAVEEREIQDVSNTFIGEYLYKLWRNECLCDVKVTVDEVDFFAHKLVLAAFSNVFCPSTPQPQPSVCFKVPCSTPDAVNQIFNYIYSSSMELKDELLEPILSAAIFMGISEVIEVINEILMKPTIENLELYIKIKRRHGMYVSLVDFPKLYQNYFVELTNHDAFLNMTVNEFEELLRDPDVLVTSELETISGIANWVKYNAVERASSLSRLLRCVSFESIYPKTLAKVSEEYSYLFSVPGAPQVISEAFKFHALKLETECGNCLPATSPCKSIKRLKTGPKPAGLHKSKKKDRLKKSIYYSPTPASTACPCEVFSLEPKQRPAYPPGSGHVTFEGYNCHKPMSQNLNSSASQNRESSGNAARYDVHPSNYFRNLPHEDITTPVGHHALPKHSTPSVSVTPSILPPLPVKRDDSLRQRPGVVRHYTVNGERQLWKCSETPLRESGQPNKARGHKSTTHCRPSSRLRKKKSFRHRHHHGFNNNAADFALLLNTGQTDPLTKDTKQIYKTTGECETRSCGSDLKVLSSEGRLMDIARGGHHMINVAPADGTKIWYCSPETDPIALYQTTPSGHSVDLSSNEEDNCVLNSSLDFNFKTVRLQDNINSFVPIHCTEEVDDI